VHSEAENVVKMSEKRELRRDLGDRFSRLGAGS
jgi:hypothetical protein